MRSNSLLSQQSELVDKLAKRRVRFPSLLITNFIHPIALFPRSSFKDLTFHWAVLIVFAISSEMMMMMTVLSLYTTELSGCQVESYDANGCRNIAIKDLCMLRMGSFLPHGAGCHLPDALYLLRL